MSLLDNQASSPLYMQLAEMIRQDIKSGKFAPGDKIPTEFELCSQYEVSRSTVRNAVAHLVDEKLLVTIHGKGTFVTMPKTQEQAIFSSTTQYSIEQYGKPLTSRVLESGLVVPGQKERAFFGIGDEDKIISIRRLRMVDDVPVNIETIYFAMKHLFLLQEDFSLSMYRMLQEKHNIFPTGGYRSFEICFASEEEAGLLKVPRGAPMMLIIDYVHDQEGNPLHISKRIHMGDALKYSIAPMEFTIKH